MSSGCDLIKEYHYGSKEGKFYFIVPDKNLKNFNVIIYNNKEKKEYDFGKLKMWIKD